MVHVTSRQGRRRMTSVLQFVAENEVWFTRLFLAGAFLMLLGFLFAARDYHIYRKEKSLLEDVAYVHMWRYGVAILFFLLLAGGVQVVKRAAGFQRRERTK